MATNFISKNKQGDNKWDGYELFKLHRGRDGKPFADGNAKFVVFLNGRLVCEASTEREANEKYFADAMDGFSKKEYLGLQEILR